MFPLCFSYQDAKGATREWALVRWSENSRYIQGRTADDSLPRTFRKDRILGFISGQEQLLFDKAPPAPAPAPQAPIDSRPQILFTGIKQADRARLETIALENGFRAMKTVSKALAVLCIGERAGPTKVENAREQGAFVLTENQFFLLLKTGEIVC